jgi:hypothetical protein
MRDEGFALTEENYQSVGVMAKCARMEDFILFMAEKIMAADNFVPDSFIHGFYSLDLAQLSNLPPADALRQRRGF